MTDEAPTILPLGLPFGRITADDLMTLASAAASTGASQLRLTPWRAILLPLPSIDAAHEVTAALTPKSFIMDANDPRLRVAACPGAPACSRATTSVRDDANTMAAIIGGAPEPGIVLHVSGCEKGCAHHRDAPITLVARDGRYDLVRDGMASNLPVECGLTLDQAAGAVRRTKVNLASAAAK
jgi:precorrin-3B synthase